MPTVNLIVWDNGVGLTRDMQLLRECWRAAGHDVFVSARRRGTLRKHLAPWRLRARLLRQRLRGDDPQGRFDFNVMLEHVRPEYLDLAKCNVLVPNPEWFSDESRAALSRIDLILAKTRCAQTLFEGLGARTSFLGFTSTDRRMSAVEKRPTFFHLAGRSRHKGTEAVLNVWRRHPEWPKLTVVQNPRMAQTPIRAANIDHRIDYLSDHELRGLQNSCLFHVCPSETEGFGHYIVEAMSVGAIVLTVDAPPMNELVTSDRGVLLSYTSTGAHGLATTYHVSEADLEEGVQSALALSDGRRRELGVRARAWFEDNDRQFRLRAGEVLRPSSASPDRDSGEFSGDLAKTLSSDEAVP